MVELASTVTNTLSLLGTASLVIIIAYLTVAVNNKKLANKNPWLPKIVIGVVFGLLSAYGTLMAVKLADGTIPNVRELGAMMAGIAGGPVGGLIAGLIGGIHRFSVGGITMIPCGVATILVGLLAGLISAKLTGKYYLLKAAALGLVLESFAMGLVFIFVPFETAYMTVYQVYIPMVAASTIGLVLWTYFLNKLSAPRN
jgi:sigma-B regulation protein RsbU (phosphoserine phosphatase)